MSVLDWIFIAMLLVSLALGAWRGLVYEVISLVNWLVAFVLAQWLAPQAAVRLPLAGASETVRLAAGFVLVFVVALFAGAFLAWLASKLVKAVGLRPVDRTLGAAFGVARGVVVVLALSVVVNLTSFKRDAWWTDSLAAGVSTVALKGLKPVLPEPFAQYLPG